MKPLIDLYDAWDKPTKAAEWRAKLATEQEVVASDPPPRPTSRPPDQQDESVCAATVRYRQLSAEAIAIDAGGEGKGR